MNSNATRYEEIYNQLKGMKETNVETLAAKIKQIDEEVAKITDSVKEIRQKLVSLPHKRSIYEANKARVASEKSKLDEIAVNYGTVEEIKQKIEKAHEELATFQNDFDKLSNQQGLLTMAIDNLEVTKNQECPVCSQSINNEELIKALRFKVSEDVVESIKKLKESQKTVKANERTLAEKFEESNRLSETMSELEKALATSVQQLRIIVPNFDALNLDEIMEDWEKEINGLTEKESELRSEQRRVSDVLTRLTSLSSDVKRLQAELQKVTASINEGPDLLNKVEELNKTLDEKIAGYSDSSEVDKLRKTLSDLADVLNYLRDNAQVTAAEEELPTVEEQLRGLETRSKQLEGLSNSLQSTKQTAIQYEKEAAISQLKRLEDDINNYYSQIQGHPYFKRIKIDVEKEDPLIFSIRAAGALEDTYIPTRFSTAQLNAVALAIFMSYNNEQAGNLPLMILDDPTQNMDLPHKETFAKLIAALSSQNQIIIATEDTDTRRFLEKQCPSITTYEFGDWTHEGTKIKAAS